MSMSKLAALEKQIAELTKQAENLRLAEYQAAVAQVRELIAQHAITPEDIGMGRSSGKVPTAGKRSAASQPARVSAPKYRDPETGKTWTGVGMAPGWIRNAADRTPFLIEVQDGAAAKRRSRAPRKAAATAVADGDASA